MRLISRLRVGILTIGLLFVPPLQMRNANLEMQDGKFHSLTSAICILRCADALAVEGDIVFKRPEGEGGTPVAVFPHWFHRIRYKCYACHPSIFEMKAGADKITMDAIGQGKFCGTCHNGKTAWAVSFQTCNRCHVGK